MIKFNHCPLVWHFCGQVNNQKLVNIKKRVLRILFADYNSSYLELLDKAGTITLLIEGVSLIALTVFRYLHVLNPPCINDTFIPKYVLHQMPDSSLSEQFRCRTTAFGSNQPISYIGAKLLNVLLHDFRYTTDFNNILQTWSGPDLDNPWDLSDVLYK